MYKRQAYVIVVLRENTARVAMGNLAGAEAEAAQNGLLNTVIETIDDGVLLVDPGGRIVMSNPAARRFLGSGKARVGTVWAAPDGLRDATGALLSRERLRDLLMEPGAGAVPVVLRSPTTQGRQRVYSVSAHPLGRRQPPLTIVVISDVSAEHDRHSQLETFAGAVAHDLKNPLASLALWMDPVSYTHLDVYKRQRRTSWCSECSGLWEPRGGSPRCSCADRRHVARGRSGRAGGVR